jgi:DtxR family transcriptional regulator, Mn-dependent transcriptional regulator
MLANPNLCIWNIKYSSHLLRSYAMADSLLAVEQSPALARLSGLRPGEEALVVGIAPACQGAERRRLLDLGILPGTRIAAALVSPSGNPVAYRVRGSLIALRTSQAEQILISGPGEVIP